MLVVRYTKKIEEGEEENERKMMIHSLVETETEMEDPTITKMMAMVEIEKDQREVADLRALRCWLS